MRNIPIKEILAVIICFSGLFIAKKIWRDELGYLQRSWTQTFILIAFFIVVVLIIWLREKQKTTS
jgi:hypothetical protein